MPVFNCTFKNRATYLAGSSFTPSATPSDLIRITGSATKTIRVLSMRIGATNTAAGSQEYFLIKRSTANTGGTFVAQTAVLADVQNPAATAVVGHYTANPATLGTLIGTIDQFRHASPVAKPATFAGIVEEASFNLLSLYQFSGSQQPLTLRGVGESLSVAFALAALVAGQTHIYSILWTEE